MNSEQWSVVSAKSINSEQLAINNVECFKVEGRIIVTSSDPTKEDCIEKGF